MIFATLFLILAEPVPAVEPAEVPSAQQAASSQLSLAEVGRAIAAGRLIQAQQMLGQAMAAGARGEPVDRLVADLAFARGDFPGALPVYRTLIAANPDEVLLLERGGIAAIKSGQLTEAVALLDRATVQPGAGWRAWNGRGVAADLQGRWDEADAAYARALQLAPGRGEVINNRGWSLMLRGRWAEALEAFEHALSLNPLLPRLSNNLQLARAALDSNLPRRLPGESDANYAARLNDTGVAAAASGQQQRARAAFAQAIEVRSRWYARAAENLAALGAPQ